MPRTTGVDILSIKPDSDLGLAQDSNIPVVAVALDQVNKANQDIRDYDHQRQIMKYDHQLKQRDNLIEGIGTGKISTNQILPEDRDAYNKSEQKRRKAFLSVLSEEPDAKGQNEKLEEYKKAKEDHEDLSTMLQSRYVEINKKRKQRSETNIKSEQDALDADINNDLNVVDKMQPIRPFQKPFTTDPEKIYSEGMKGAWVDDEGNTVSNENTTATTTTNSKGTTVRKTTTPANKANVKGDKNIAVTGDAKDGELPIYTTTPGKRLSDAKIYKNIDNRYNNDEEFRQHVDGLFDMYQGTSDPRLLNHLLLGDTILGQKDQENGIPTIKYRDPLNRIGPPNPDNPNDPVGKEEDTGKYPSQINMRMIGDKAVLEESKVSFAAKMAAAFGDKGADRFVIQGQKAINPAAVKLNLEVDKYKADLLNDKNKRALELRKLGLEEAKFNASNHENFASSASVINEATSMINKGELVTIDLGGGKTSTTLRISDPTLLNTFGNIDKNGTVTNVPDAINYDKEKNQVVLIYYDKEKVIAEKLGEIKQTASGKNIVEKEIPLDQRTWLKHIAKRSFPNKDIGDINTQVDYILEKNDNSLYRIAEKQKGIPEAKFKAKMGDGSLITSPDGTTWYDKNGKKIEQ